MHCGAPGRAECVDVRHIYQWPLLREGAPLRAGSPTPGTASLSARQEVSSDIASADSQ